MNAGSAACTPRQLSASAASAANAVACGAAPCNDCCVPYAYETPVLCKYTGSITGLDTLNQNFVITARIVRAATAPSGYTYAIGVAVNAVTGVPEGVLTVLGPGPVPVTGAPPAPVLPTVALETLQPSGVLLQMDLPRAIIARGPNLVTIVGSGAVTDTTVDPPVVSRQPMVAHVCVSGPILGAPQCIAGNGSTTFLLAGADPGVPGVIEDENYYDVAVNPCDVTGATLYVCGVAQVKSGTAYEVATVRIIDGGVGTPNAGMSLAANMLSPLGGSSPGFTDGSVAVSLAVQPSLGLVTMAVNGYFSSDTNISRSCLWSVAAAGLGAVAPGPLPATPINTLYNDPSTGLLPLGGPAGAITSTSLVRVLSTPSGALLAVGRVTLEPAGMTPLAAVAIWAFGSTTAPDMGFGALGTAIWSVPDNGATICSLPTDAALSGDGTTLVFTGNAYPAYTINSGGPDSVVYPSLPHLDTLASGFTVDAAHFCPFLAVAVLGSAYGPGSGTCGAQAPDDRATCAPWRPIISTITQCLPGCAAARLLNAVVLSGPLGARATGDVFRRVGCPLQPAGVLDVGVTTQTPLRITNASRGTWSGATPGTALAGAPDGGPVRVDYCAPAPSTLLVAGPIIVGGPCGDTSALSASTPLAVPGTIYYESAAGATGAFYVCIQPGSFRRLALEPED
jgi:hypothetical protein